MPVLHQAGSIDQLTADATALAEAVSLAIRIEPQLLRQMRLALFPTFDAGTEADLWFSAAVGTRTSSGIVFHPSIRETLRQQLGAKNAELEIAWTVVESLHCDISPALFAEEKLAYLTLAGKWEEARGVLRSVVATLVSPRGRGLAGWAAQAVDRLPEAARPLEEAQMLTLGASLRLGSEMLRESGVSSGRASEWAAWLAPDDLEMVPFGVALLEDAVEFGPVGRPTSHRILVPKTTPIVVEVGWSDGASRRTERAILNQNGLTLVELGAGVIDVDLKTVLGDAYSLTVPAPRERRSSQKKLDRVRPPRVQITYDVETGGAIELRELPFVVTVLADLTGSKPSGFTSLNERRLIGIDDDNFDAVMEHVKPRINIVIGNPRNRVQNFPVELEFFSLKDFEPAAVARQIEPSRDLLEKRTLLATVRSMIAESEALERQLTASLVPPDSFSSKDASHSTSVSGDIADVLEQAGGVNPERARELAHALLENLDRATSPGGVEAATTHAIEEIDAQISEWVNQALHQPAFQALEATWRGLNYLVQQTETSAMLKIQVWDVAKSELARDSTGASTFDQTAAFRKLYEEQFGVLGGSPIGLLIGAYEFDRSREDIALLEHISAISAASHAPFVAAASPAMVDQKSFKQLDAPRDLAKTFAQIETADWRQLRASENARYLALTLPHILLRVPYGSNSVPVEEFQFEEEVSAPQDSNLLWGNAAFALAARVTQAFALYSWPAAIRGVEGGGLVVGLPSYTYTDEYGDVAQKCTTEIPITHRREAELTREGFIPLCFVKGTDTAAFFSVNSIQKPSIYEDEDATASAQLFIQLSYQLAASRFAHYTMCVMRDKIGSFMSPDQVELFLNTWISKYVQPDPNASMAAKAEHPLQSARIEVEELEGRPGAYRAILFLRPDFQLDPLITEMRVVMNIAKFNWYA